MVPDWTVFLCVVDPGVGGTRPAMVVKADGRWYVGPGNGLFGLVQRRAGSSTRPAVASVAVCRQPVCPQPGQRGGGA